MFNKRIKLISLVLSILWSLVPVVMENDACAQSWLNSDWNYRSVFTINNSGNADSLSNYQVKIKLDSTNFDFSKAQSEGEDVRFTESDGLTLIDHWIEYWEDTTESASVWLKIPGIPGLDSVIIYMYYGNPDADDSSNGKATFEFFDDFESDDDWNTGWSVKEPLPLVKAYNTAAVYNDSLYVFGGYDRDTLTCTKYYLDETFAYDPSTDTWTQLADMPTARWGAIAIEFGGLIHVFAGEVDTGGTAAHEVYDPATDSWSIWSDIPSELAEQGITGVKYGNKIHLFCRSYHYEYDPAADTFIAKAAVPTSRTLSTCALVDSLIYVIGGYAYGSPAGATDVNEAYNPLTDTWTTKAPMPISRYGATRENPVIGGKIYVTHGLSAVLYSDNYVYNPADDTWETRSAGINQRDGVGCGVINDKLYIVGGRNQDYCVTKLDYMEEYDPTVDDLGGSNPWVISNNTIIKRDSLAKYKGDYGLLFDKQTLSGWESAEYYQDMVACAVDIYWNITDYRGLASSQPQGAILMTGNVTDGTLLYYNYEGTPTFRWYNGSYLNLQTGSWNNWYPVTVIWNGVDSRVIIEGTEHEVSASSANSDRVYLRVNKQTRQYLDLVRVRKYSSPEPFVTLGLTDSLNLFPHLTVHDSSSFLCEPQTTCFSLLATDPDSAQLVILEKVYGPGEFDSLTGFSPLNTSHCFLPGSEDSSYLFIFRVTDSEGAFDQESSYVHIYLNQSPILSLPQTINTLLCNLGDSIQVPLIGEDLDSGQTISLEKLTSTGVLLPSDSFTGNSPLIADFLWVPDFSDTLNNPHELIFALTDSCGEEVRDTLSINVRFNHPPVLNLPADTVYSLCEADTIRFNYINVSDPDPEDSVIIQKIFGPGYYDPDSGICCFLPSSNDSTYKFIFQAEDLCGAVVLDSFNLTVMFNRAPVLTLPADTSYLLCDLGDSVYFEVSAFDSDLGDSLTLSKVSIEGELRPEDPIFGVDSASGTFIWHPDYSDTLENPYQFVFQVVDECGLSDSDTLQIWIIFNHPPNLSSIDSSYAVCEDSTICFDYLRGSDSDPGDSLSLELVYSPECSLSTSLINPSSLSASVCFLTSGDSVYTFIFRLKDRCGASDLDTVFIEITPPVDLLRGDANGDTEITVSDVIYIINYLFKVGPYPAVCYKSADTNCDYVLSISDVIYLINYLFKGGPQPGC